MTDAVDAIARALPVPYAEAVVLLGATIVGIVAGALGPLAVLRGRALVGDGIAHATLPGVCLAFLVAGAKDAATLLVGAALAAAAAAVLVVVLERQPRVRPDAAIAIVVCASFSLGVVLLTVVAGREDADQAGLDRYLFGQTAGLLAGDVALLAAVGAAALVVLVLAWRPLKATLFDRDHAAASGVPVRLADALSTALVVVAVVVGVRAVGAILMVALLVAPAVAARQVTRSLATLVPAAALVGALAGALGTLAATRLDVPPGPAVAVCAAAVAIVAVAIAPRLGRTGAPA